MHQILSSAYFFKAPVNCYLPESSIAKILQPSLERQLPTRRRLATAHQKAAAAGRGFGQPCGGALPCAVPAGPGRPKAPFSRRLAPAPPRPQQWGRIFRINKTGIRIRGADGTRTAAQCPPGATRRRRRRPRQEGTQERNSSIPSAATHLAFPRLTPPRLSAPFVHEIFAAGTRRLATAWTRRRGAAWTYRKIITTIH